jgi:hypothetical protein
MEEEGEKRRNPMSLVLDGADPWRDLDEANPGETAWSHRCRGSLGQA